MSYIQVCFTIFFQAPPVGDANPIPQSGKLCKIVSIKIPISGVEN